MRQRDPGPALALFLAIRCLPAHGWRNYAVEYGRFDGRESGGELVHVIFPTEV